MAFRCGFNDALLQGRCVRAATVEAFPTTEAHGPFWVIACDVHAATLRQLKVEVYELDGEALVALAEQGAEQVGDPS